MKNYLLIAFYLLFIQPVLCQKQKTALCNTYECIISKVKASLITKTSKEYQKLLTSLEDAENYLSDKQKDYSSKRQEIRNLRLEVFKAIEGEKEKAILAEKKALQKTKEAQIATNNATALYWTSEVDKLIPLQGLRLLEKALPKAKDVNIIKTIKQANATIFNQSNYHQWREKKRFEVINSYVPTFSPDSKWLITTDGNDNYKVWSVETGKYYDFLKDEKTIRYTTFSPDSKWLCIITNHQVKTYDIARGKLIQTLWLNKVPTQIDIIDNRYLYVTVGKAIVKTDLETQQGNLMSYGDGEELDYEYDEIVEWKKVFGKQYLLPLDEEIKKKYGVKD